MLQEREVERLGSLRPEKINVRILATTNRELKKEVAAGNFREDLFYRLNVIAIELPPLRERKEDVKELAEFFMGKYAEINRKGSCALGEKALCALQDYSWPGNVRELEHTIERAVVLCRDKVISERDLFLHGITLKQFLLEADYTKEIAVPTNNEAVQGIQPEDNSDKEAEAPARIMTLPAAGVTIAEMERDLILKTLDEVGGNRTKAADLLGITVRTLRNKLNEYRESGHYAD